MYNYDVSVFDKIGGGRFLIRFELKEPVEERILLRRIREIRSGMSLRDCENSFGLLCRLIGKVAAEFDGFWDFIEPDIWFILKEDQT